ncbi:hypothetical protein [Planobispora longispora]|uniref:Uncharacterized protein n=1 Tax=Planobispora longispora TaxID=28887 RepID=A0A8J3RN48_9ACTN|nr:hypothetical protein [Planobispora longispora]BFE85034.1 hypothetical protein GCM10020093_076350 [Planobispora longispora]GIH75268.1 hypothetical protein Plo01_16970 [Planobispora longispora]
MVFNTNALRRTAAGVSLVLAALAFPTAAQAATAQTSAATAGGTYGPVVYGLYPTQASCASAAAKYNVAGKSAYCVLMWRLNRWALYVSQ